MSKSTATAKKGPDAYGLYDPNRPEAEALDLFQLLIRGDEHSGGEKASPPSLWTFNLRTNRK
jgi:hypothetical protein